MITIKEPPKPIGLTIQTNDIPGRTTFRGTIYESAGPFTGLFLQALSRNSIGWTELEGCKGFYGPLTVCLRRSSKQSGHATFPGCFQVDNYEPVEVELTVKE